MSRLNPRQIDQAGATDGQALVWSATEQAYVPGSVASGGDDSGWRVLATGTGSSQNITLPASVSASGVHVYVNGIRQWTDTYSVTGTTLTLTAPTGARVIAELPSGAPGPAGADGGVTANIDGGNASSVGIINIDGGGA